MSFVCEICKKIVGNANHLKLHNIQPIDYYIKYIDSRTTCSNPKCNTLVRFKSFSQGFSKYCSNTCAALDRDEEKRQAIMIKNNLKKYGVEHCFQADAIKVKIKKTNLNIYGTENPQQNSQIRDKTKATNIKKYGAANPHQNYNIIEKTKATNQVRYGGNAPTNNINVLATRENNNLKKYGVRYPSQLQNVKNKMKSTSLMKYGIENYQQRNITNVENMNKAYILKNFTNKRNYIDKIMVCEYYNISIVKFYRLMLELNITNPIKSTKYVLQTEIFDSIAIDNKLMNDRKVLSGKELDIYIPDHNFGIEFDGLMYHSFGKSNYSTFDTYTEESKNIHLDKMITCENMDIQLFRIFENEWISPIKQHIWKSMINNKLKLTPNIIYGRQTTVRNLSDPTNNIKINQFLDKNHMQGRGRASVKIGLYYDNELISVMTFGKSRFNKKYEWELIRFCTKCDYVVVGGASKLFKYFTRIYQPTNVVSFANKRWSNGNLYTSLGFNYINTSKPNYFYFKPNSNILESRIKFQKHKLAKLLKDFDPNLSESLNMYNHGYRKIYDCGNMIFVWNK